MRKTKKMMWVRKLSCGHERPTHIAYIMLIYDRPKVGDECYCRECWKMAKIKGVREATKKEMMMIKQIDGYAGMK